MTMRAAIHRPTGRLIELQSGGDESSLEVLRANAVAGGWPDAEVETRMVDDAEAQALLAAANPPPRRLINLRDFMDRIPGTAEQRLAKQLAILASGDAQVRLGLLRAGADVFNLDSPETAFYVDRLVSLGLLDEADKAALLA